MRNRGFTLIELMIVVAVIAVLALIAYPSYQAHILRGNQSQAQRFALDVVSLANQFRLDTRNYPSAIGTGAGQLDIEIPDRVNRYYSVALNANNAATPPTLIVTATPRAGTMQADAKTLSISNTGKKTPPEAWE